MSSPAAFSLIERLADLPYFRALNADRLAALADRALCRTFAPQTTLFAWDEPAAGLWIIEDGRVKICRVSADGREHILRFAGPGDSFNEIPALDGGPNPASAITLSDVTAWVLPADVLRDALRADHELAMVVIDVLAQRTRELVQQIEDLALCSVTARLARFILLQLDNAALSGPGVTRASIAAHLATTPETVSRALRTLEDIGAIRFDRQDIVIVRPDLLHSVAME
jgi:CRP-like cAMP-binding protein